MKKAIKTEVLKRKVEVLIEFWWKYYELLKINLLGVLK